MINFASLLGVIPKGACTIQEVTTAGVSVKKELRTKLSNSDQLKLSKQAKEGGSDKFSFFETTGSIGSDFKAVYDLHMRIEALSKALVLFDMTDVFQILPESTVSVLETKLQALHACQADSDRLELALIDSPQSAELLSESATSLAALASCTSDLQTTTITTMNLIKSFKDLKETTIRRSNAYYTKYRATWSVENLSWLTDMVFNTCEESFKIRFAKRWLVFWIWRSVEY